uniref:Uncharacterized protein n=1 Tax=Hordeum vulgare TaxID=4513 RepID=A0A5J6CYH9_HORVU|nr:unknown function protein 2 [Hordeum vulgare]
MVAVLGKYDWREMVYVGAPSKSHSANNYFSHGMALGGGGVALSFPLAAALAGRSTCALRGPCQSVYDSESKFGWA